MSTSSTFMLWLVRYSDINAIVCSLIWTILSETFPSGPTGGSCVSNTTSSPSPNLNFAVAAPAVAIVAATVTEKHGNGTANQAQTTT
eukprot:CAMPEP_0117660122 /NCGR_PEP_ID=MMETSP0804-20121206/6797_1 /TAXON_ID=1074897 /ORGANISM="Tetraselmis astigmatica, Strain CCMP880" /LENGTH=86 /DNA_ID=CAMNT_0005466825 /DNA_START=370 /DNA_END=630 /DNA_ORIENTATION=+